MKSIYRADDPAAYEQSMGRWSRLLAERFIAFSAARDGARIIDIGCGTGSLSFALAKTLPSAQIVGIDFSQDFVDYATARIPAGGQLAFMQGDAAALRYPDESFDAALSLLVLNFVPDAHKAARELMRVTRPGGVIAAAVWDYRGGLTFMRVLADTAAALDPVGAAFRAKQFGAPFTRPDELAATWREMGLHEVTQTSLSIRMDFADFADYWRPWLRGQGTLGAYITSLSGETRSQVEHHVRLAYLAGDLDGPRSFTATAWACRGIR
jgi:ubiquinone/menaquinone biosynthesis C-methylase UbiE